VRPPLVTMAVPQPARSLNTTQVLMHC
jgi:hypothetical protein